MPRRGRGRSPGCGRWQVRLRDAGSETVASAGDFERDAAVFLIGSWELAGKAVGSAIQQVRTKCRDASDDQVVKVRAWAP